MDILIDKYMCIPYLEIVVTTKCSLRCKDCANLMQYYNYPYFIEIDIITKSILRLLDVVDSIDKLRILGGEPFLHPNLDEVIDLVASSDKIKEVQIVTNGTVLPVKQSLINILQNEKVSIAISDYGKYSSKKNELMLLGKYHKIKVELVKIDYWLDYSSIHQRKKTKKQLQEQYRKCNHQCTSLLNGKLFDCPRSGHGMDLGIIPVNSSEYIDLISIKKSIHVLRKEITQMFSTKRKFIQACDYCDVGNNPLKINPAIQIEK